MMNPAEFANIAQAEDQFWWYRGMRRILFRMLDPYVRGARFDRVLEAGCGTGHFALALERRYGWKMFPADLAREGLEYALSLGAQRLTQADICALPFASSSFDALVSMDVMVHLPPGREAAALSEFARVTKPGGLVVLRVSALDILRSRHSEFCMERQRFTRSRLLRAAAAVGLEVLRSSYANSLLLPVALFHFRVWEPLFTIETRSGVEPVPPWLDRLLYAPLHLEAALLGAGVNLPLGQSLVLIARKRL